MRSIVVTDSYDGSNVQVFPVAVGDWWVVRRDGQTAELLRVRGGDGVCTWAFIAYGDGSALDMTEVGSADYVELVCGWEGAHDAERECGFVLTDDGLVYQRYCEPLQMTLESLLEAER